MLKFCSTPRSLRAALPFGALIGASFATGCGSPAPEPVVIRFEARFGERAAACATSFENIGSAASTVEIGDARFYVSNFRLTAADGSEKPLALDSGTPWQNGDLALLDFENGQGRCAESGTAEIRQLVSGTAPRPFTGIRFDLGMPSAQNHLDATTAPPPLNLNALYWSWQAGHIFAKVDYWLPGVAVAADPAEDLRAPRPNVSFPAHIASTGCVSAAPVVPPAASCARPNVLPIELSKFDPRTEVVVLDLAELVRGIDLSRSVPRPPGCMSGPDDPDCPGLFANLGLDLATGRPLAGNPPWIRAAPLAPAAAAPR